MPKFPSLSDPIAKYHDPFNSHQQRAAPFGKSFGLSIFYFLNKYDNISIHCNLHMTGSERKQEYLYSSSPEHIKFVKFTGRILNVQSKVY